VVHWGERVGGSGGGGTNREWERRTLRAGMKSRSMGELVISRVEGVDHTRAEDGSPHPPSMVRYSLREDWVKGGPEVEWEKCSEMVTSEAFASVVVFT